MFRTIFMQYCWATSDAAFKDPRKSLFNETTFPAALLLCTRGGAGLFVRFSTISWFLSRTIPSWRDFSRTGTLGLLMYTSETPFDDDVDE